MRTVMIYAFLAALATGFLGIFSGCNNSGTVRGREMNTGTDQTTNQAQNQDQDGSQYGVDFPS